MTSLTPGTIRNFLNRESCECLDMIEVFPEIDSTNRYLLDQRCPPPGRFRVALAEHQTNGRGRRNRIWISPPSTGLCMSLAFTFRDMPRELPSLSLAIGIGIAQAIERLGIRGIGLKWPNDIIARNGKLGGVLPEVHPSKDAGVTVVVGIGLNIDFGNDRHASKITTSLGRATDLASCCDVLPMRSVLAAAIIDSVLDTIVRFEATGFAQFLESWRIYDWLHGQEVTIETARAKSAGIAQGVDADGALLLNAGGNMRRVTSGTVVLRESTGANP